MNCCGILAGKRCCTWGSNGWQSLGSPGVLPYATMVGFLTEMDSMNYKGC